MSNLKNKAILFGILVSISGLMMANTAHAQTQGVTATGNSLPLGTSGGTVLTITGGGTSGDASFTGTLETVGNATFGGSGSFASTLSVTGVATFSNTIDVTGSGSSTIYGGLEIGTEGNGGFVPVGTSELGPTLSLGGTRTNNTDPIYFQRYNENYDTTSLRLVIGDNYGSPYTPGASGLTVSNGDAFIIGSLNSANGTYDWVPNFTFTSDTKLGIGTLTPQASLDVNGTIHVGGTATAGNACSPNGTIANDGTGVLLSCVNGVWQANKSRPSATEQVSCEIGDGESGSTASNPCSSPASSGTQSIHHTTANVHDLCVLRLVAGWAGGFWGQCVIDGSPGNTWTLTASNYQGQQVSCSMQCYDF